MQNIIENVVNIFLKNLDIEVDSIEVKNLEPSDIFKIKIKTQNSGLIIGSQGKTLDAFQNLFKLICSKQIGKRIQIHIQVNDYITNNNDTLLNFIKNKIEFIEKTGNDIKLPFYPSYERRKIHSIIHKLKYEGISTKSIGEGKERRLYICKERPKLTIDIDGVDI